MPRRGGGGGGGFRGYRGGGIGSRSRGRPSRPPPPPPRKVKPSGGGKTSRHVSSKVPAKTVGQSAAPSVVQHQKQPSLFGQMAATAGGVTLGSAVGHTIGHAVTGLFTRGMSGAADVPTASEAAAATNASSAVPAGNREYTYNGGACAFELKQFLECAQNQSDLTLCAGFNEALRQCKIANNLPL